MTLLFLCEWVGERLMIFFFFNDTATTEIYTLSLHDALPLWPRRPRRDAGVLADAQAARLRGEPRGGARGRAADRKSTRLNSSHSQISYAVFCLKKKKSTRSCILHPVLDLFMPSFPRST